MASADRLPSAEIRLLIFGLRREVRADEVQALLGCFASAAVDILAQPGDADEAVGVVHLPPCRLLAWQLADKISQRRLHGRLLRSWVPVMAWG